MIKSAITIMIPILFAAFGGLMPALAGCLNIALEGLLLIGAFTSFAVFYFTDSILLAIMAAAAAGVMLSAMHAFTTFKLKANIIITGLAVNLFSAGICTVLSQTIFNTKGVITINNVQCTMYNDLLYIFLICVLFILVIMWVVINKTPFGFRLRACDKNQQALVSLSIKPQNYQIISILTSGLLCGIGGSFLSLNLGSYVSGISSGKGWIALVVVFLGFRKPQGLLIAAFFFSLAEAFSNHAQGFWVIPSDFILAIPYICTFMAIIIVSIINKHHKNVI